ncbi:MAG: dATP/dGTP diphosphohydrolase domain-containing protein [Dehalococcoidia bacterium]
MDTVTYVCATPTCSVSWHGPVGDATPQHCDRCHLQLRQANDAARHTRILEVMSDKIVRDKLSCKRTTTLPHGSAERKAVPLCEGVLRYFPAALAAAATVSKVGNDKHNGEGTPLTHTRGKSMDHADCIMRHLMDLPEDFGKGRGYDEQGMPQVGYLVWRALALAQEWLEENEQAPLAPGASE